MRILAVIFLTIFAQNVFAEDYVSTNDIVKEVEKSLLFSKSSREQIDFYKKSNTKKSVVDINAGGEDAQAKSSNKISVVVTSPKPGKTDLREKEQLAYNSVLIGQYEVAIELYKQVLKADPNDSYAKFSLATVYQKIGQFRQAKTIYYQMLKAGAENQDEIVGNLMNILIEDSPYDATYLLSRLAVENPDSPSILAYSSLAYSKMNNYEQAASMLEKAIVLDSENLDYKYNLAVIYDRSEKYEKAIELYSEVLRNQTSDSESIPLDQIKKRIEFLNTKI